MRILVVNAGTSSVKVSLVDGGATLANQELPAPDERTAQAVVAFACDAGALAAVGHRIVHGGDRFRAAVVVDGAVRRTLGELVALAPLHMPPALALIDALREAIPLPPQVGCFDTAFHASLSEAASTYALPERWRALGVRRYGFHGLSCAWSLRRAAALLGRQPRALHLVVAHLGSGASATAIREGLSADTSMGFTPLEGLVMAQRSGSVDPGAITWLQSEHGVAAPELYAALEGESGVLGLAGSADMREVLARAHAGDARAALAVGVYVHRACAQISAVAASLDRLDALVFTGGVGEHAAGLRAAICAGLGVLGLPEQLAEPADGGDAVLSAPAVGPAVLRVRAREDLEIASEVAALLG